MTVVTPLSPIVSPEELGAILDTIIVPPPAQGGNLLAKPEEYTVPIQSVPVDFLPDAVRIHLGRGMTRLVRYEDFLANVQNIFGKEETSKSVVWKLPEGVFYFSTSENRVKISLYYPECSREVSYYDDRKLRRVPNIVLTHELSREGGLLKLSQSHFYATKFSRNELSVTFHTTSSAEVGILPFTNVYQDARLCYGNNSIVREFKDFDLRPLHAQYELLFSAPFNDDLGLYALKNNSPYRCSNKKWYAELARRAADGKGFPYSEMVAFSG